MLAADLGEVERMAEHELHLGGEFGYVILAAPDPDDAMKECRSVQSFPPGNPSDFKSPSVASFKLGKSKGQPLHSWLRRATSFGSAAR